ncbi:MAG: glycoside hydrolase family 10 protein [Cyanobacteriota bacterium]|jgi:uncharacterized lipoprotein YddW (UPF0748 family)
MRRQPFRLLCLALLSWLLAWLPAAAPPGAAQPAAAAAEIRGVWMTSNDMATLRNRARMQAAVAQLSRLHFNTLYPVVWNGGHAYYPSAVSEQRGLQSFSFRGLEGQDILAELIQEAHRHNLKVIPWFEFGFMTPPDSELARRHPDWLTQKRDGGRTSISAAGEVAWLNPLRPEVQELITSLVLEVTGQYDADGIQFDDHMSLPSDFGYDRFTTALYQRQTGRTAPTDPQDPAWLKWRADQISSFMQTLHQKVRAARPQAIVSVSPNYYDFAYKLQLQDWRRWVRLGIVDELIVQVYRPDLESFVPQLDRPELQESLRTIPTAVAIMSGQRNRPVSIALIRSQVEAARQRGLGVAFFYYESLWEAAAEEAAVRQAALQELFPTAAPRSPA